jgi:hypothetical protein
VPLISSVKGFVIDDEVHGVESLEQFHEDFAGL